MKVGYVVRGAQVAVCNSARQLAVDVHAGEHADEFEWKRQRVKRLCSWWRFGTCKPPPDPG